MAAYLCFPCGLCCLLFATVPPPFLSLPIPAEQWPPAQPNTVCHILRHVDLDVSTCGSNHIISRSIRLVITHASLRSGYGVVHRLDSRCKAGGNRYPLCSVRDREGPRDKTDTCRSLAVLQVNSGALLGHRLPFQAVLGLTPLGAGSPLLLTSLHSPYSPLLSPQPMPTVYAHIEATCLHCPSRFPQPSLLTFLSLSSLHAPCSSTIPTLTHPLPRSALPSRMPTTRLSLTRPRFPTRSGVLPRCSCASNVPPLSVSMPAKAFAPNYACRQRPWEHGQHLARYAAVLLPFLAGPGRPPCRDGQPLTS